MIKKCLLFDFDGTLADTRDLAWDVLNQLSDTYGFQRLNPEDVDQVREMSQREFLRFLGVSVLLLLKVVRQARAMMAEHMHSVKLFDGAVAMLGEVREAFETVGILTTNTVENVKTVLVSHQVDCFDFICSAPRLSVKHKYLRALMKTHAYSAGDMIYVGDEIRDIRAACKAGVMSVGVGWGFNTERALKRSGADHTVSSLGRLNEVLKG